MLDSEAAQLRLDPTRQQAEVDVDGRCRLVGLGGQAGRNLTGLAVVPVASASPARAIVRPTPGCTDCCGTAGDPGAPGDASRTATILTRVGAVPLGGRARLPLLVRPSILVSVGTTRAGGRTRLTLLIRPPILIAVGATRAGGSARLTLLVRPSILAALAAAPRHCVPRARLSPVTRFVTRGGTACSTTLALTIGPVRTALSASSATISRPLTTLIGPIAAIAPTVGATLAALIPSGRCVTTRVRASAPLITGSRASGRRTSIAATGAAVGPLSTALLAPGGTVAGLVGPLTATRTAVPAAVRTIRVLLLALGGAVAGLIGPLTATRTAVPAAVRTIRVLLLALGGTVAGLVGPLTATRTTAGALGTASAGGPPVTTT